MINYEDRKFYSHFGVDFLALMRAFVNNFNSTQRSGASTISMQTIKLWDKKIELILINSMKLYKA